MDTREKLRKQKKSPETGWNRTKTAEIMGVSEGTVRNWIRKFELREIET